MVVKAAWRDVSPVLFIALRFTLATAALLAAFRGRAVPWRSWKTASTGALQGVSRATFFNHGPAAHYRAALHIPHGVAAHRGAVARRPGLSRETPDFRSDGTAHCHRRAGVHDAAGRPGAHQGGRFAHGRLRRMRDCGSVEFTLGHFSEKMSYELLAVSQIAVAAILGWALFSSVESSPRGMANKWSCIVVTGYGLVLLQS